MAASERSSCLRGSIGMAARKPRRPLECSLGSHRGPTRPILRVRAIASPCRHKGKGHRHDLLWEECLVTRVVQQSVTATLEKRICHPQFRVGTARSASGCHVPKCMSHRHSFIHSLMWNPEGSPASPVLDSMVELPLAHCSTAVGSPSLPKFCNLPLLPC